jgi:hypothetical protein
MRSTHLHRASLLVGLLVLALAPHRARACDTWPDCMMLFYEPEVVFERADMVFRGRLLEHRVRDAPDNIFEYPFGKLAYDILYDTSSAKFEVEEAWKGVDVRYVTLKAEAHGCYGDLLRFEPGTDMVVFAHENRVDICYRALPIEHEWAQKALAYLGPGERDLPAYDSTKLVVVGVAGVVVVLGGALLCTWWWRRRSRDQAARQLSNTT